MILDKNLEELSGSEIIFLEDYKDKLTDLKTQRDRWLKLVEEEKNLIKIRAPAALIEDIPFFGTKHFLEAIRVLISFKVSISIFWLGRSHSTNNWWLLTGEI